MTYLIPRPTAFNVVPDYQSAPGVSGFHLDFISATQMFLNPGYARAFGQDFAISFPGNNPNADPYILIDLEVRGAGGCYPYVMGDLTLADDTVFGIYIIGKSSGTTNGSLDPNVNVSAVIATGDNFLPPGYDVFRRVGLCYISSSTNELIKWIQAGNSNERQYTLQDGVRVLNAGSATTFTDIDLTTGDGPVPPGHANYVQLLLEVVAAADDQSVLIEPSVLTTSLVPAVMLTACAAGTIRGNAEIVAGIAGNDVFATDTNSEIKYKVSDAGAAASIWVTGFTDSLGNAVF